MHPLYALCCTNEFNQVFKPFLHLFGVNAGILLSHLISKMNFYYTKDLLVDGEWFYRKRDDIEESTALTRVQQRNALNVLSQMKIIESKKMDNPAKLYYKINTSILLFVLNEYTEFKKYIENNTPEKLSEIGRKALPEYRGNETLPQEVKKHYHKRLRNITTILISYIKLNYIKIEKSFSFQNDQKSFSVNTSDIILLEKTPTRKNKKEIPENLKPISFRETLELIPPELEELKNNEEFMQCWKKWFRYRKIQTPKSLRKPEPLTKGQTTYQFGKFKNYSLEEIIDSMEYAIANANKAAFPKHFSNGNGNATPKPPAPKKKKPKERMTPMEQWLAEQTQSATDKVVEYLSQYDSEFDENLIYSQLEVGANYLGKLYDKVDAYEKQSLAEYKEGGFDYDIVRSRVWREHLPTLPFIIERYIQDLSSWVREPSANFFKWDHKTFVKFRKTLQRTYFEYDWEKGTTLT